MAETSLEASVHALLPECKDSLDREASFPDHLGRAAGRKYADILLGKTFGQVEKTGLVVD